MDTDDVAPLRGAGGTAAVQPAAGSSAADPVGGAVATASVVSRYEPVSTYEPVSEYEPVSDDDEWMIPPPARGLRMRVPTLVLLALAVAAGGFWGGSVAQRHQGSSATATGAAARIAAARAAGFGGFGGGTAAGGGAAGAPAGAAPPATSGTVTDVKGTTVYVTNAAGALVKVVIGAATTVTRTGTGSPGVLQIGDTAVVQGSAGADGTIAATSIVATAMGVTAPVAAGGATGG